MAEHAPVEAEWGDERRGMGIKGCFLSLERDFSPSSFPITHRTSSETGQILRPQSQFIDLDSYHLYYPFDTTLRHDQHPLHLLVDPHHLPKAHSDLSGSISSCTLEL